MLKNSGMEISPTLKIKEFKDGVMKAQKP